MRKLFIFSLVLCFSGCVSKKEEQMRAREAYLAGQQAGARTAPRDEPSVVLRGPLRNPVVPWVDGLTLSKAIVDADYTGFMNPLLIRVIRDGQIVHQCKGIDLLHGEDFPLEAGDIVDVIQ